MYQFLRNWRKLSKLCYSTGKGTKGAPLNNTTLENIRQVIRDEKRVQRTQNKASAWGELTVKVHVNDRDVVREFVSDLRNKRKKGG